MPVPCGHCKKYTTDPPAWIHLLVALSPGKGNDGDTSALTAKGISEKMRVTRQRVWVLLAKAIEEAAVEPVAKGSNTYRKSSYGIQILSRWYQTGWKPEDKL